MQAGAGRARRAQPDGQPDGAEPLPAAVCPAAGERQHPLLPGQSLAVPPAGRERPHPGVHDGGLQAVRLPLPGQRDVPHEQRPDGDHGPGQLGGRLPATAATAAAAATTTPVEQLE